MSGARSDALICRGGIRLVTLGNANFRLELSTVSRIIERTLERTSFHAESKFVHEIRNVCISRNAKVKEELVVIRKEMSAYTIQL